MQLDLIAPCPKKPTMTTMTHKKEDCWLSTRDFMDLEDVQNACLELQQILHYQDHSQRHNENSIVRAGNPLIQDSSFIPLHQAVSQLHLSDTSKRPRSLSVGEPRHPPIAQPIVCKAVF
ncbi:hypothetical protein A0J61_10518 [Choanephora cucurbitarum]|uniref:Uncharacterized protein n=1 Tax=Choanephora cucurbitarum TaxID=101091 RepID=A0A1C7MX10_9FUNG|nr:hypothetical protein A0J61_10518 [Choanephora cucurbitarum]